MLLVPACLAQDQWQVASPDSRIVLKVDLQPSKGRLSYEVTYDGQTAVATVAPGHLTQRPNIR